jgi:hypothetical protein
MIDFTASVPSLVAVSPASTHPDASIDCQARWERKSYCIYHLYGKDRTTDVDAWLRGEFHPFAMGPSVKADSSPQPSSPLIRFVQPRCLFPASLLPTAPELDPYFLLLPIGSFSRTRRHWVP